VQDGRAVLGGIALDLVGRERGDGILGWTLGTAADAPPPGPPHPNGALALDHVVMTAADFERTRDELLADGLDLRRERDDLRELGAFDEVVPNDEVLDRALAVGRDLAALPSSAYAATKRRLRAPTLELAARLQAGEADPLGDAWTGADTASRAAAILRGG